RPSLSRRDRSIVTVAVLIAMNQPAGLPACLERALDDGVKPGEVAEIVTHLAFYAGWPNAAAADRAAGEVFSRRGIEADQLPPAKVEPLPLDQAAEDERAALVEANFGQVAPGVVQYTAEALFLDLWLRPDL